MELNSDGTVKADSVRQVKRVFFKKRESETLNYRLAIIRNKTAVRLGEIAVIEDREWLKVYPARFKGVGWIEVI